MNAKDKYSNTPLSLTAAKGEVELVHFLLHQGSLVNEVDQDGRTALWHAAIASWTEITQDLLRQGAIVNMADKYGVTPLLACVDGAMSRRIPTDSEPSASNVAQDGASSSTSICDSNLATVQALLQAGARPDEADHDGMTPLVAACSHADQSAIVLELLKGRADPNLAEAEGQTPLIAAAEEGCWEAVKGLLAAGADVDCTDSEVRTALMAAAEHGCVECVEMLLHAGADPNHCDEEGTTALMAMASADTYDEDVLQALLSAGADLNTTDGDGETALIKAVALVNVGSVEWLLEHGAEADLMTHDGQTAVQVARTACYQSSKDTEKVISMLEAWCVADMLTDSSSTLDDSDSDSACGGASAMVVSVEEDGDKATEADGSGTSEICSVVTADLH